VLLRLVELMACGGRSGCGFVFTGERVDFITRANWIGATLLTVYMCINVHLDYKWTNPPSQSGDPFSLKCEPKVSNPLSKLQCKNQSNKVENT
jgi:hypothetical protein